MRRNRHTHIATRTKQIRGFAIAADNILDSQHDLLGDFLAVRILKDIYRNLNPGRPRWNRYRARRGGTKRYVIRLRGICSGPCSRALCLRILRHHVNPVAKGEIAVRPMIRCCPLPKRKIKRNALLEWRRYIRHNPRRAALANARVAQIQMPQVQARNRKALFVQNPPLALDRIPEVRRRHALSALIPLESGKRKPERQPRIPSRSQRAVRIVLLVSAM